MSLKEAVEKFVQGVEDLAVLEITTYTGTLEQAIGENTGQIDWSKFTPTSGTLILGAATRISPDLDMVNFRANHTDIDDPETLYKLHQSAVESAINGRMALLQLFKGVISAV